MQEEGSILPVMTPPTLDAQQQKPIVSVPDGTRLLAPRQYIDALVKGLQSLPDTPETQNLAIALIRLTNSPVCREMELAYLEREQQAMREIRDKKQSLKAKVQTALLTLVAMLATYAATYLPKLLSGS